MPKVGQACKAKRKHYSIAREGARAHTHTQKHYSIAREGVHTHTQREAERDSQPHAQNIRAEVVGVSRAGIMSVLALQEYEFERQFNEDEAIRWMQENW